MTYISLVYFQNLSIFDLLYWGERKRAPTLMMSMAVMSVRLSGPTTYVQDHVTSILKLSHV